MVYAIVRAGGRQEKVEVGTILTIDRIKSDEQGNITLAPVLLVDGDKISFIEKGTYQGMPLQFNYTGEIAGDEIRFKRELMGFPAEEFVAKRSK